MQHFQPYSAVLAALRDSQVLDVVNDSEIKRKTPLKLQENMSREQNIEYFENEATKRSIYAKGFGEETSTTQLDVENFFKPYGPINSVRLRRSYPDREFKGSVFVEFETTTLMQEFLDLENKPKWKDTDELLIKSKADYCQEKIEDIKSGKIKANETYTNPRERHGGRGRGRGRGGNDRNSRRDRDDDRRSNRRDGRDRDSNDWKGRRDNFQKGGFKDRNDRNGKRGGRDNFGRDRESRNNDEGAKQEVDDRFVAPFRVLMAIAKLHYPAVSQLCVRPAATPARITPPRRRRTAIPMEMLKLRD
jgi:lupus La protein